MSNNLWLTFKSRIQSYSKNMTRTEQRIANYMIAHPDQVMNQNTKEIARAVDVSTASVIRFCQTCGYSGLPELKLQLKSEYISEDESNQAFTPDDIVNETHIKQLVLGYHMEIVRSLMSNWNEGAYQHAVDEILKAKHILVVANGGSHSSAVALVDLFLQINLPVEIWEDDSFTAMRIEHMEPGDVVIALTYTGRFLSTLKATEQAYKKGITTIGITGFTDTPIVDFLSIVLGTRHTEGIIFKEATLSARILEMSVIQILYTMLSYHIGLSAESDFNPNEMLEQLRIQQNPEIKIKD